MASTKRHETSASGALNEASEPHPTIEREPLSDVLRLIRSENVGPVTFFQLMRRYGTAAKALSALPMLALRGGARRTITVCPLTKAETEMEKTQAFGAAFIPYGHAHYPKLLMQIADPPPLLVVKGHSHLLNHKPLLAMVGSRNASAHGCQFARKLAGDLGEAGYVIVSGLARGIDAYAHQGAIEKGTIGVIAGGIDHVYPPENAKLYEAMRASGVVVSEAPFWFRAAKPSFSGSQPHYRRDEPWRYRRGSNQNIRFADYRGFRSRFRTGYFRRARISDGPALRWHQSSHSAGGHAGGQCS